MNISSRIKSVPASTIMELLTYSAEAKKKGKKVYHLNIGQPDIITPKSFFEAISSNKEDVLEYALSEGLDELREAIKRYYNEYNIDFEKEDILILNGGSEALFFCMIALCNEGDNILIPEPFYSNYNSFANSVGVEIKPITTLAENGFHLPKKEEIVEKIDSKTRAILFSNPGNPTGVVYSKEEIKMISDIAKEHDLWIIADEVYREFVYDGEYTSLGSVKEVEDRVIIVDSVSKRYSACGARIGSLASKNKEFMAQILKLCQARLSVPTLEQIGAVELYKTDKSYLQDVNKEYKERRDVLYNELVKVPGVICKKPTGAFYIVAKLPVKSADDFVKWLLKDFDIDGETVMPCPAEGFYATEGLGKDEIRLAYILNKEDLAKASKILKEGLEAYLELDK
ncbi:MULTISPECIES: pyridoxal phosphate-dependent aminotransferase [Romboutsia]|uniref:Aminotransferase n=1 Tax=Romboutsia hominis TaxID=1507512 RepID=A0A2P2BS58_9FIRM|nr:MULTISPECIES: pyridoxal phosphate-dependent aminotransferase [Romboutsia]MCH1960484.1 pyridoxal phosphate-dependent aminotransferase [Romboutsia hominis]MCH1969084.1 pyridoxal phosphate-dependent aminotransferase [Romboutsia hominis]MDB8791483.1 pyridoxal phosphate-dependent aminotransferase [Romboutsia sp. 1001216sp1]MDB8793422.1 pyridoxal phosphate-dependent aminotransferase [Romboutsia sp. 1001216sp1]MDB8796849.1 pyridoxal phosphate-dependent aminotransferase [Romboutsia sp. 1001216sp1]